MNHYYQIKKSNIILLFLLGILGIFSNTAIAQTTVTITATGSTGSFITGSTDGLAKFDGDMTNINASTTGSRGWASYNLSTIPAGAIISAATANFTTYSSTSSTALNELHGFAGDPATLTAAGLFSAIGGLGANLINTPAAWTANAANASILTAGGISFLQSNITGTKVNVGYVRASTNNYNIAGYPGTNGLAPNLVITYSVPSTVPGCATGLAPANAATNVPNNGSLSWTAVSDATSYDVYLGTSPTPSLVGNVTTPSYPFSPVLNLNTVYYYKVVPKNSFGPATGCATLSFTTSSSLTYCTPGASNCTLDDEILNVTFGTINNSSTGCTGAGYFDYTGTVAAASFVPGQSPSISVEVGPGGNDNVAVWIDYNQNGTFEASEYTLIGSTAGGVISGPINIPANALSGTTRMRVRVRYSTAIANTDACTTFTYGEAEDYLVSFSTPSLNGAIVNIIPPSVGCGASNAIVVKLRNSGATNISAGAATVALNIIGANPQGPFTQTNPAIILPGDTATLTFTGSFTIAGTNIDSAYIVSLAGNTFYGDDTLVTAHITLPAPVNAPYAQDFEGSSVPGWTVSQISGTGNWGLADSLYYPDFSPAYSLYPKSGSRLALFDSYNYTSGTASRLRTNCIILPANANSNCGYIAGFYFAQDAQYNNLDSLVLRATTDGGTTYKRLGKVNRQDSTLTPTLAQQTSSKPVWKLYTFDIGSFAGQTVQFAIDAYSAYGNQMGIDSFFVAEKTVATNVALAGGTETGSILNPSLNSCTDASGWTYYSDANSARYLFGIQWDPSSTGANALAKITAKAKLTIDRKWFAAEDIPAKKATYTMQRYWDVSLGDDPMTGPVNVRFFYSQSEFDSIVTAKNNFIAANPGAVDEGFMWFKTITGPFIPNATTVTPDGVVGVIQLTNTNTTNNKINAVLYAQFNGITSFSGGTVATGVGPGTPLPISLLTFNAQRTGRVNKITWSTSFEINTSYFAIERSADGRNYSTIGQVAAVGNSNSNTQYSFVDNAPTKGINYYRLKIVDADNSEKYSPIKNVRNEGNSDVVVYPNPVKEMMQVSITSDRTDKASISVIDMNGKLVYLKSISIIEGTNNLNINTGNLNTGTYIIKIQFNEDLVVKKFNKL